MHTLHFWQDLDLIFSVVGTLRIFLSFVRTILEFKNKMNKNKKQDENFLIYKQAQPDRHNTHFSYDREQYSNQ